MIIKSPFYVVQEFLSPYLCEEIIDMADFNVPDTDKDENPVKTTRRCERGQAIIYERFLHTIPEIQAHYQNLYKGTEAMDFEWFPETAKGEFLCGNSKFLRNKWLRVAQRDLTCVIFLCDYQDKVPFEKDYEVYGGKLEFPQHRFGFNPQRGTLIVFPAAPHFINMTTEILVGDLFQVRFHTATQIPLLYNPQQFPGDYTTWFRDIK